MSRILMACLPAHGVANPSFPFTKALTDAGHQVDYLLTEAFRGKVERCGAHLIPYGHYLDGEAITEPRHVLRHGRRLFGDMNAGVLRLGNGYDAVLACGLNPDIPRLERGLDVPVIFVSPVFLQNERTMNHLVSIATGLPAPMRRVLGTTRLRRALTRVIGPLVLNTRRHDLLDLLGPQSSALNLSPASRYYQPFADDFGANCLFVGPTPTITMPDDSFPLDRLATHDGPVVYATLGTVFNRWTRYFRTIARAFQGSDALVVITTGSEKRLAEVGDVPDNVILRSFVPQTEILREADLCFTHGGFGSATDAVSMGVPPILTPMGADQFFNAYRIQELGAGRVLPKGDVTAESVRRLADEALAAGPSEGLRTLQESFRAAGGPARAVRAIEDVLAGRPVGETRG